MTSPDREIQPDPNSALEFQKKHLLEIGMSHIIPVLNEITEAWASVKWHVYCVSIESSDIKNLAENDTPQERYVIDWMISGFQQDDDPSFDQAPIGKEVTITIAYQLTSNTYEVEIKYVKFQDYVTMLDDFIQTSRAILDQHTQILTLADMSNLAHFEEAMAQLKSRATS